MASSDRITRLTNIRDNLEKELEDETAYRYANGPKTTYSAQGRSYDWNGYLAAMSARIKELNDMVQATDGAWEEIVQGYS